jgi:hypothetical protein
MPSSWWCRQLAELGAGDFRNPLSGETRFTPNIARVPLTSASRKAITVPAGAQRDAAAAPEDRVFKRLLRAGLVTSSIVP